MHIDFNEYIFCRLPGFFNEITINAIVSIFFMMLLFIFSRFVFFKNFISFFISMVSNIARENIKDHHDSYVPFLFCVFLFLALNNLLGLFFNGTVLAVAFPHNILANFTFSMFCFFYVIAQGLKKKGIKIFGAFVPAGVPKPIVPLVFSLEIFSFCLKPITLTIRLFMNMVIGHILLDIATDLGSQPSLPMKAISILLGVAVFFFEIFSCLFQSYIYINMLSGYINVVTSDQH